MKYIVSVFTEDGRIETEISVRSDAHLETVVKKVIGRMTNILLEKDFLHPPVRCYVSMPNNPIPGLSGILCLEDNNNKYYIGLKQSGSEKSIFIY